MRQRVFEWQRRTERQGIRWMQTAQDRSLVETYVNFEMVIMMIQVKISLNLVQQYSNLSFEIILKIWG